MEEKASPDELIKVLSIAHDTSGRGEGISLREALVRSRYIELRPKLTERYLAGIVRSNPRFVSQWTMYCQDKRTSGGWYLNTKRFEIGRPDDADSILVLKSVEETVASYVLHELDFWAHIDEQ